MPGNSDVTSFAAVWHETGIIAKTGTCAIDDLVMQIIEGQDVIAPIPEGVSDETHLWDEATEAFVPLPPQPGPWAVWADGAWSDPRTPLDHQTVLYGARAAAQLDKSELLTRMFMAGLFSPEDVLSASEGSIPAALEPMLSDLPAEAQIIARIKWRNDAVISRMNPVIMLAGLALGVTDEQMDDIFGVQAPA